MMRSATPGFAALISVVTIAAFLLATIATASYAGFYARASMLAYERREVTRNYTDACIHMLRLHLMYEPAYRGGEQRALLDSVSCNIGDVEEGGSGANRTYSVHLSPVFTNSLYEPYVSSTFVHMNAGSLQVLSRREIPNGE